MDGLARRAHSDQMSGFVVTAVFAVEGGVAGGSAKIPLGADVLGVALGPGHRFSYCDGRTLTVVCEVVADGEAAAFEVALTRFEGAWAGVGGGELPAPSMVRLQRVVPEELVPAGSPGRARAQGRRKRSKVARRLTYFSPEEDPTGPVVDPGLRVEGREDDDPDDGGMAGVREPRRPGPGPGPASAAQPLPGPEPLPRTLRAPVSPGAATSPGA